MDLNYKSGYRNHMYYKYLLTSRPKGVTLKGHSHIDKNDTALLDAYRAKEISDEYIIWMAGQGFTVVDHPSEVYRLPDAYECIDGNLPLHLVLDIDMRQKLDFMNPELSSLDGSKISHEDLLSRILIACVDIVYSDLKHLITLNAFVLASFSNASKCSWHIVYNYARFVDYRDLRGFVKKVANRVGKPYSEFIDIVSSVKKEYQELEDYLVQPKSDCSKIWSRTFSEEKLAKKEFKPIENNNALVKEANLVIAKYGWLQIRRIEKGFINFQAQSIKECP
ncbi:7860_t:CDS:2, partial [Cetraspora pellucida]